MLQLLWDCCVLGTLGDCWDPGGLGCRCRVCFSLTRADRESSRLTPPSVSDPSSLPKPTCLSRNKWWSSAAAWFWPSSSVHLSTASSNRDPNKESLPTIWVHGRPQDTSALSLLSFHYISGTKRHIHDQFNQKNMTTAFFFTVSLQSVFLTCPITNWIWLCAQNRKEMLETFQCSDRHVHNPTKNVDIIGLHTCLMCLH